MLAFSVLGVPIPKGSTKAFWRPGMKHAVVTHDNAKTRPWQESVVDAAQRALAGALPLDGPVGMALSFYLPRPKTAPRRVTRPTKKPDLDKLVRSIKDGLTRAGVYRDDAQVIVILAEKAFAGGEDDPLADHGIPRADVRVYPMAEHAQVPTRTGQAAALSLFEPA